MRDTNIDYTHFGKYLAQHQITLVQAANALAITRSYCSMLSRGAATPGLLLANEIEKWSGGHVSMSGWIPYVERRRAAAVEPLPEAAPLEAAPPEAPAPEPETPEAA